MQVVKPGQKLPKVKRKYDLEKAQIVKEVLRKRRG